MRTAGRYKDRIALYNITSAADGEGGFGEPVYTLIGYRFADVHQMNESETLRSGLSLGELNYRIKFRKGLEERISRLIEIRNGDRIYHVNGITSNDYEFEVIATERDAYITPAVVIPTTPEEEETPEEE